MNARIMTLCAVVALGFGSSSAFAQMAKDPQGFADLAGSSNMFEVQSSELALEQASSDDVKAFAEHMIEDHTAAGEKMKAAAAEDGVTPPATMAAKEQAQLDQLRAAEGEAFDQAYVTAQTTAHEEAVALFEAFSTQGEESALRGFAAETLPTLQEHLAMVRKLSGAH